ncbi:hypothetical protein N2152v2_006722 [Parachlorella kessleri]
MEGTEKVGLAVLAALVTVVALVEVGMTVPVLLHARSASPSSAEAAGPYPSFLVLGDWGRDGDFNQSRVAAMMALKAEELQPNFVISTGDNFYEAGLVSPEDPQFESSFSQIYHHASLQVPWHAVLGNHDYGEVQDATPKKPRKQSCGGGDKSECYYSPLHQASRQGNALLDVRLRQRDSRWHCERSFSLSLAGGRVDIFFIDTTPMNDLYLSKPWADNKGGILEQSWQDQVQEFESRLARSTAEWKIVVGHHPVRSNHAESEDKWRDMEDRVQPLLTKYGVQLYLCGHDHTLQYIYNPSQPTHYVVSGAGSQTYNVFYRDDDSPFQYGFNGFVAVDVEVDSMRVEFLGIDSAAPLFVVDIPRNASVAAANQGGSHGSRGRKLLQSVCL